MTEEEIQELKINKAVEYRGKILNTMCFIDFMLNVYISHHFCGDDEQKAQSMILLIFGDDRMTMSAKAQIFYAIATKHDKEWYNSYKSIRPATSKKGASPTFNSDLTYIIEERNIFAHRVLGLSELIEEKTPKDVVRFIKMKNDLTPLDYTDKSFNELYLLIIKIGQHFSKKEMYQNTLAPSA